MRTLETRCCIAGGGPAGMMLGLLLARAGVDVVVLGCTHYPLLAPAITRFLGDEITLVDSAHNCAGAVRDLLERQSLSAPGDDTGTLHVALTDSPDAFLGVARQALQLDIGKVQLRDVLHSARA